MPDTSYNVAERTRDAVFIASDQGSRSYRTAKLTPVTFFEASTPLSKLADGSIAPTGAGLVAQPATETFYGYLVAEVVAGAPGEKVLGAVLRQDAEVFGRRVKYPAGADAAATDALRTAIVEASKAAGILTHTR